MLAEANRVKNIEMGFSRFFSLRNPEMVDLSVGEPGFDTPEEIKKAAYASMKSGNVRYAPPAGKMELREKIAEKYKEHDVEAEAENVMVGHGAKGIIYALMQSFIERGDEVIIQDPGWVSYTEITKLSEGTPVPAKAETPEQFVESVKEKITPKTKMIIFSTPVNPTGQVYPENVLEELVELGREHDVLIVSDEPYHKIVFDGKEHISTGKFGLENVAVVNSFSKTYAMSGWRIGYIIAEPYIVKAMTKVQLHQSTSVAPFIQDAALHALLNGEEGIRKRREIYERRRNQFISKLNSKLVGKKPEGTFYYFAKTDKLNVSGKEFVEKLIEKGVLAVPGHLFGSYADNYVRFSFAKPEEELDKGAERINEAIDELS